MSELKKLIDECGLSTRGASALLGIEYETLRNMIYGKVKTPEDVLHKMRQLEISKRIIFESNR